MFLTKKGINILTLTPKNSILLWISFLENTSFFTKNSLQGEKIGEEDNFWEKSVPCPIQMLTFLLKTLHLCPIQLLTFLLKTLKHVPPNPPHKSLSFFPKKENNIQYADMGRISLLSIKKEILQKDTFNSNSELQVYTRKRISERNKGSPIIPM